MSLLDVRQIDVDRIYSKLISTETKSPCSLIIQGLPGSGCEYVYGQVINRLRNKWRDDPKNSLITINLASYWIYPVTHLIKRLITELNRLLKNPVETSGTEIDSLLSALRDCVSDLSKNNRVLLLGLDNFDVLTKFTNPVEVQYFLNILQSIGSDPTLSSSFLIKCYKDIEDICRATNYSDFYKIFGLNHYRVTEPDEKNLIDNLTKMGINENKAKEVIRICGGVPEHIRLILESGFNENNNIEFFKEGFNNIFDEWMKCLSKDEQRILTLITNEQKLDNGDLFSKNKLIAKGILQDENARCKIKYPLFEKYIKDRYFEPNITKGDPFIRGSSQFDANHLTLIKKLLPEMEYVECKIMQHPRPEEAIVYQVSGENKKGLSIRPCIVKIHTISSIDNEIERTEKARVLLGPVVPVIKNHQSHKSQKAILFEFATADNRDYNAIQFAEFYKENPIKDVVDVIRKLFQHTLFHLYKNYKMEDKSAKDMYAVPKSRLGECDELSQIFSRIKYYDTSTDVIQLFGKNYQNPGTILRPGDANEKNDYHKIFVNKRKIGISASHNDLNPRNILIDGIGDIHIIDFAIYKEDGARFTDLVHLEVSVKFKLHEILNDEDLIQAVSLEKLLVDSQNPIELDHICKLPLSDEYRKLVEVVRELRSSSIFLNDPSGGTPANNDIDIEYKIALLAHTLRIVLYADYLSELQQRYAIISASLLLSYLINKC